MEQQAFKINRGDNVATALCPIESGDVSVFGDATNEVVLATESIPVGHKIALSDIERGEAILKYGVVIGKATKPIRKGSWVHLHVMESCYDERSSHLDIHTGAPLDTRYS